jgi:hypothetical protein
MTSLVTPFSPQKLSLLCAITAGITMMEQRSVLDSGHQSQKPAVFVGAFRMRGQGKSEDGDSENDDSQDDDSAVEKSKSSEVDNSESSDVDKSEADNSVSEKSEQDHSPPDSELDHSPPDDSELDHSPPDDSELDHSPPDNSGRDYSAPNNSEPVEVAPSTEDRIEVRRAVPPTTTTALVQQTNAERNNNIRFPTLFNLLLKASDIRKMEQNAERPLTDFARHFFFQYLDFKDTVFASNVDKNTKDLIFGRGEFPWMGQGNLLRFLRKQGIHTKNTLDCNISCSDSDAEVVAQKRSQVVRVGKSREYEPWNFNIVSARKEYEPSGELQAPEDSEASGDSQESNHNDTPIETNSNEKANDSEEESDSVRQNLLQIAEESDFSEASNVNVEDRAMEVRDGSN